MPTVTLCEVTRENWREALALAVHPEQQRFVADSTPVAAIALAKAYVRPGGLAWEPYAIAADGRMVGFLMLAYEPGSADNYWLYHFFLDRAAQGHGYARPALRQVLARLADRHPTCRRLSLTVHPDNHRARALYTAFGFRPTGTEHHGEPAFTLLLSCGRTVE